MVCKAQPLPFLIMMPICLPKGYHLQSLMRMVISTAGCIPGSHWSAGQNFTGNAFQRLLTVSVSHPGSLGSVFGSVYTSFLVLSRPQTQYIGLISQSQLHFEMQLGNQFYPLSPNSFSNRQMLNASGHPNARHQGVHTLFGINRNTMVITRVITLPGTMSLELCKIEKD